MSILLVIVNGEKELTHYSIHSARAFRDFRRADEYISANPRQYADLPHYTAQGFNSNNTEYIYIGMFYDCANSTNAGVVKTLKTFDTLEQCKQFANKYSLGAELGYEFGKTYYPHLKFLKVFIQ